MIFGGKRPPIPPKTGLRLGSKETCDMVYLEKSLPRRTVLKGLGTTLALPFLDAMLPPMRAAAQPVHRFQAFYTPNGMAMEYWTPKGEGADFELSPILQPLAPYKDQLLVMSSL